MMWEVAHVEVQEDLKSGHNRQTPRAVLRVPVPNVPIIYALS